MMRRQLKERLPRAEQLPHLVRCPMMYTFFGDRRTLGAYLAIANSTSPRAWRLSQFSTVRTGGVLRSPTCTRRPTPVHSTKLDPRRLEALSTDKQMSFPRN